MAWKRIFWCSNRRSVFTAIRDRIGLKSRNGAPKGRGGRLSKIQQPIDFIIVDLSDNLSDAGYPITAQRTEKSDGTQKDWKHMVLP